MIKVTEVIITDMSRRGSGKAEGSPIRAVFEIYTKNGELLASDDPCGNFTIEQLFDFAKCCAEDPGKPRHEVYEGWKRGNQ